MSEIGLTMLAKSVIQLVHREIATRLFWIEIEDYEPVKRKVREELQAFGEFCDDEYLNRGIEALKQYYAIVLLDPANMHALAVPLDPFWHAHILHTRQYVEFSEKVFGQYIHHNPLDKSDKEELGKVRDLYSYTLDCMPKLFRSIDRQFWPEGTSDDILVCAHLNVSPEMRLIHQYAVLPERAM